VGMKGNIKSINEGKRIGLKEIKSESIATQIKVKAIEALQNSDMSKVLKIIGMDENKEVASAAMKELLAQKFAEYAIAAIKEAKKRNMRLGAAAIIIAANNKNR
jgi:predicted N-acetyltransferase YhbS